MDRRLIEELLTAVATRDTRIAQLEAERAGTCTRTGRVRAVWPESPAESVDRVVTAAVARRDATGVSLDTALLVEAVLARDEASER